MSGYSWLHARLSTFADRISLAEADVSRSYGDLAASVKEWQIRLRDLGCDTGVAVAFQGDYNLSTVGLLLACIQQSLIAVPIAPTVQGEVQEFLRISEASLLVHVLPDSTWRAQKFGDGVTNPLTKQLIESNTPGLVIFSSGSSGTPKATLHSVAKFLNKFESEKPPLRTIAVPPMDHVAGLDTLFYSLSSGGTLVCPEMRDPETICAAIERHRVELLPASAAFLNLLVVSGAYERYDLSSLRIIAFGSDVMPESTLRRLREILPGVMLLQKYGTTEFGSPSTKSLSDGSLWLRIDDQGFETKIVEGVLWVRSQSAMIGYLNAPSPFQEDGWINTGDAVEETDDGYVRILGRKSEMISVGGHKVYPAEVESVLLQMANIEDVAVFGVANPIMGTVVGARIQLRDAEALSSLKNRIREFCRQRLSSYKVPIAIEIAGSGLVNLRQKKLRRNEAELADG